jgi:adenylate cyclase class 2
MIETEVKIRIQDRKAVLAKLLALGAVPSGERYLEENTLYDFPGEKLRAGRRALRLRKSGRRQSLTFKGSPLPSRSFKVREEFETSVSDGGQLRKILKALGLRPSFTYRKHRMLLRKGNLLVCLDETSAGDFLELEGKRHEITRFARSLGFGRADFLQTDYVELIGRERKKGGEKAAGG